MTDDGTPPPTPTHAEFVAMNITLQAEVKKMADLLAGRIHGSKKEGEKKNAEKENLEDEHHSETNTAMEVTPPKTNKRRTNPFFRRNNKFSNAKELHAANNPETIRRVDFQLRRICQFVHQSICSFEDLCPRFQLPQYNQARVV